MPIDIFAPQNCAYLFDMCSTHSFKGSNEPANLPIESQVKEQSMLKLLLSVLVNFTSLLTFD